MNDDDNNRPLAINEFRVRLIGTRKRKIITATELKRLIKMGKRKARQLGYNWKSLDYTFTMSIDVYIWDAKHEDEWRDRPHEY